MTGGAEPGGQLGREADDALTFNLDHSVGADQPPSSTGTSRIWDEAFMTASTLKRLVRDTGPPARRTQDRQLVLPSQPVRTAPGGGS